MRTDATRTAVLLALLAAAIGCEAQTPPASSLAAILARAKSLEINTPYVPPPG